MAATGGGGCQSSVSLCRTQYSHCTAYGTDCNGASSVMDYWSPSDMAPQRKQVDQRSDLVMADTRD